MKTKKISKIGIVLLAVFIVFGCSFGHDVSKETKTGQMSTTEREKLALLKASGNFTMSEGELENLVTMFLNPQTGGKNATESKTVITGSRKLPVSTEGIISNRSAYARSAESEENPVDVFVFTTENPTNEASGYVIATNDLRIGTVIAMVEEGTLEDGPEEFNNIIFSQLAGLIDYTINEYNSIDDEEIQETIERVAARSAVYARDAGSGSKTGLNCKSLLHHYYPNEPNIIKAEWSWTEGYYVPIPDAVNWHQDSPYVYVVNNAHNNGLSAGCAPVAVAQVMAHYQKPDKCKVIVDPFPGFPINNRTYNWTAMRNGTGTSGIIPTGGFLDASILMFEIGKRGSAIYTKSGTAMTELGVMDAFHSLGYKTHAGFSAYKYDTVKTSIKAGDPVIAVGNYNGTIFTGHYWVIDGVRKMTYREYISTYDYWEWENRDWVRCNVGWSAKSKNAWYVSGIFDFNDNRASQTLNVVSDYFQYGLRILAKVSLK